MRITFLLLIMSYSFVCAQTKKSPVANDKKKKTKVVAPKVNLKLDSIVSYELARNGDTINRTDLRGYKQGKWVITTGGEFDEPKITTVGKFKDDKKFGPWITYGSAGIISEENYYNNSLDGTCKYYENGNLIGIANYYASHLNDLTDTLIVKNPVTDEEHVVVIKTEGTKYRHGEWKYFDPYSGKLKYIEYYVIDELIYSKDVETRVVDTNQMIRSIHVPNSEKMIRKYSRNGNTHLNIKMLKSGNNKPVRWNSY